MRLWPNETRVFAGGRAVLAYQGDGNLVVYHDGDPVWASMACAAPGTCQFQADGNLVCYDATGRPYWASGTHGVPGATLALQADGNVVIYAPDGRAIWATQTLLAPRPVPPMPIYGNFLANGLEPWGFMAPTWFVHERRRWQRFVTAYVAAGYRHLPFALYGAYRDEAAFDVRSTPNVAREMVQAHLEAGITPIIMAIMDEPDGSEPTPEQAWQRVRPALEALADLPVEWGCGWEINQVAGFREARNPRQGHDLIGLCQSLHALTRRAPWLHLQPNWWGPHYSDGDEDRWWRDVGDACQGLLLQLPHDEPLDQAWHLAAAHPRASDGARGIVGRLAARGKRCVLFEFARDLARWHQGEALVRADGRFAGIC